MKAIALFSGGLDSSLSINLIKQQGIDVTAVTFLSSFSHRSKEKAIAKNMKTAERFGFEMIYHDFTEEQFGLIKNPKFGLGRNMNPCMDCHILMLKEAKKLMEKHGADFIITGEVLGQRPKSQRRETFPVIDKEAGVEGLVLRPLSAKIMPMTIPEEKGWVDRSKLLGIGGRGRKTQISLAREIGWEDFPAPAGGCPLTEEEYSRRLKSIIKDTVPSESELGTLNIGRHFKYKDSHIIVGRKEIENNSLEELAEENDVLIQIMDCGSPVTVIKYSHSDEIIAFAAGLCARYADRKNEEEVTARIWGKLKVETFVKVKPLKDEETREYIIG